MKGYSEKSRKRRSSDALAQTPAAKEEEVPNGGNQLTQPGRLKNQEMRFYMLKSVE